VLVLHAACRRRGKIDRQTTCSCAASGFPLVGSWWVPFKYKRCAISYFPDLCPRVSGRVQCGLRELVSQNTHEGGERRKTISKREEPSRFQWVPRGCYDDDDPSPLRARENHGGRYKGSEAASRGRGEREEQESDGVQDTGWGHAKGKGVGSIQPVLRRRQSRP